MVLWHINIDYIVPFIDVIGRIDAINSKIRRHSELISHFLHTTANKQTEIKKNDDNQKL